MISITNLLTMIDLSLGKQEVLYLKSFVTYSQSNIISLMSKMRKAFINT